MAVRWPNALIALGGLATALTIQWVHGAFTGEFGAHPDEGAHYVTGLMMLDYLAAGLPGNPLRYALAYYGHYPAVGLGNWPPAFYGIEAVWMAVAGTSRTACLVLIAVCGTAFAALFGRVVRERFGLAIGLVAAATLLVTPHVRAQLGIVSPELLLAALLVLATIAFARLVDNPTVWRGVWFGAAAAAAILTKGNALALALLPPVFILLDRRWDLLRRPGLWVAAVVVMIGAGPWQAMTIEYARQSWAGSPGWEFTSTAFPFFVRESGVKLGFAIVVLAAIGLVRIVRGWRTLPTSWRGMVALAIAVVAFHSVVPASLEVRYMVPVLPALLLAVFEAVAWLASGLVSSPNQVSPVRVTASAAVASLAVAQPVPRPQPTGLRPAADAAATVAGDRPFVLLVSSRNMKEVAMVAEVAQREHVRPRNYVVRGLRALGDSDWMGNEYVARVRTKSDLRAYLDSIPIAFIAIDTAAGPLQIPHHDPLREYVKAAETGWVAVRLAPQRASAAADPRGGTIALYQRRTWVDARRPPTVQSPRGISGAAR